MPGFCLNPPHRRLGRQRGKHAFRAVETELDLLMRTGQLGEIADLDPRLFAEVESCYRQARA